MLGVLGEWVKKGADLITWITESEKRMKAFGSILAGVVVTGLGLAAAALWAMVPAITAATGGINLIIPLIALGVGALVAGMDCCLATPSRISCARCGTKMLDKIGAGLKTLSKFVGIFNDDWADAMESAGEGLRETAAEMGKAEKATEKLAKKHEGDDQRPQSSGQRREEAEEQSRRRRRLKIRLQAVQGLKYSWTGATLKSGELLRAFRRLTPRAEEERPHHGPGAWQDITPMRKVLGPFNDELEKLNGKLPSAWISGACRPQKKETRKHVSGSSTETGGDKGLPDLSLDHQEKLKNLAAELAEKELARSQTQAVMESE